MKITRKHKKLDSAPKLVLEEIIGLTTKNANGLASNVSTGDCIYLAGCVVVIYNVESGTQSHLMVSSRTPKPLNCVAVSQNGRCIASGEAGHQPAVLVWDYSTRAIISELKGHRYGVASIAFSPDGKHMVSLGFPHDGYLCLWDWRSGTVVGKLKASSSCLAIASVSFSSDATYIVTAGKKHLKFWMVGSSTRPHSNVGAGLLAMDGKLANLGCQKGSSFVSVASPTWPANSLVGSNCTSKFYPIYALTDAGVLCLLHSGFSIKKWVDLKVEKSFALSVSNNLIACACSNGIVQLFTVDTLKYAGRVLYSDAKECDKATDTGCPTKSSEKGFELAPSLPDAIACQFPTSEKLVVVYGDHSLYVWDIHNVYKISRCSVLVSHSACIWDVKILSGENMDDSVLACLARGCSGGVSFATCSTDGTIRLWDLALQHNSVKSESGLAMNQQIGGDSLNTKQVGAIHLMSDGIFERNIVESAVGTQGFRSMAVSSDGKYLAAGDNLGNLHVYNLQTSNYTCFQEAHDAEILSLSFSLPSNNDINSEQETPENHYLLASGGRDRVIHLYDVKRGFDLIESLDDHSAAVTSVKLTRDGCKILSCSADRSLVFRDVAITNAGCKISRRQQQIASHGTVYDMAVDSATEVAVTVGQDKKINTFNIAAGKLVKTFKQEGDFGDPIKVTMDPSSSYLVCSYSNKSICIYDFTSGELITQAVGHGEVITGVIFLPDCKHIISVGGDGCIFIWKVPALLSSKMFQRMKEQAGPQSPITMVRPLSSSESKFHEEVVHQCNTNSKGISMPGNCYQNGQRVLLQEGGAEEVSAFKFSISRLPKWAQAKVITKETVSTDLKSTSSQQVDLELTAGNGETSVPLCPKVHTPCKRDLGGGKLCLTDKSSGSFGTNACKSSPMPKEIPSSFATDSRWLTINNVCFDLLDSPEDRDFKDVMVPISVPNLLQDPAIEGLDNCDSMEITLGDPIMRKNLFVEPLCGSHNQVLNESQDPPSEHSSSTVINVCNNKAQFSVHSTKSCSEAVAGEKQLHSGTDEVQTTTDEENSDMMFQDSDLFSQHFGNLSTVLKLEGRKSSARRSYSARFVVCRDHLTGCKKLFDTPSQHLGAESLNHLEEGAPHSSSEGPPIPVLTEQQLSDACNQDAKNLTSSLNPACTLRKSDPSNCSMTDNPMDMEGSKEKAQREGIPEGSEIQEKITECREALHSLDAAAQNALQLFSKLGILASRQHESSGFKTELYDHAVGLLPSITEKVHALADLAQSGNRNSCSNNTRVEASSFDPLLGKFAESLSHRVLELVKNNL